MPLLKRRPEIQLFAPSAIAPGRRFDVRVRLRCSEAVPVDAVQIELVGTGVWFTSSQYGRHRNTLPFSRWVASPLTERTELAEGDHDLRASFELPPDVPGSYTGRFLSVEWTVRVHVDIPWWPDARATFVVFVIGQSTEDEPPQRVFASSPAGPSGRKPYVEVSLGSAALEPGGRLRGRVALGNTTSNDYRALRVALISAQTVPGLLSPWTQNDSVARWVVALEDPREDAPIDFALKLPPEIAPGFRTRKLALAWFLEVRVDVAWAIDTSLWIPVIVRARQAEAAAEQAAPLAVGSDRLALVWAQAARQAGYNYRAGELSTEIEDGRLVIRREHHRRRGVWLRAEVSFRDLDLGLQCEGGALRVRDAEQSRIVAEHTDALVQECPIAEADDERIVCILDDPGTRLEAVAGLAERFAALWRGFVAAREALPAPADMAEALPAFRTAARHLGGELEVASMDIRGVREEIPFALEVQWDHDGTLSRTVLEVRPVHPVDGRWHQSYAGDGEPGPMPPGLDDVVREAWGFAVDAESITVVFPPCGADVMPHVARIEALLEVARRLSGRGPAYR